MTHAAQIYRYQKTGEVNKKQTVIHTAFQNYREGSFHVSNVKFDLEIAGIEEISEADIRRILNEEARYLDGMLTRQGGGWFSWGK